MDNITTAGRMKKYGKETLKNIEDNITMAGRIKKYNNE